MSHASGSGCQHRSNQELNARKLASAKAKCGGEAQFQEYLTVWQGLSAGRQTYPPLKAVADGFMSALIVSHQISREEAAAAFGIGHYRYHRLRLTIGNLFLLRYESEK